MSAEDFEDNDEFEPSWWSTPDPNRTNYYQVRCHHSTTNIVQFFDIHAVSTTAAMTGVEALNPGWTAEWAHHQFQSRGAFAAAFPR